MLHLRFLFIAFLGCLGALKAHEATSWNNLQPLREQLAVWLIGDLYIPMALYEEQPLATQTTLIFKTMERAPNTFLPSIADVRGHLSTPLQYRCMLDGPPIVLFCELGLPGDPLNP